MKRRWILLIAAAVFAADRVTKVLSEGLPEGGVVLIPGVLQLRPAENTGIAFSMLSGVPWLPAALGLAAAAAMLALLWKKKPAPWPCVCLALMLGGAAGNLWDRLAYGAVRDMIEPLFMNFAVFNVADACLTVGCALLMVSLLWRQKDWKSTEEHAEKSTEEQADDRH